MNSTILNLAFLDEGLGLGFVLRMNIRDSVRQFRVIRPMMRCPSIAELELLPETTELIIILLSEFAGFC